MKVEYKNYLLAGAFVLCSFLLFLSMGCLQQVETGTGGPGNFPPRNSFDNNGFRPGFRDGNFSNGAKEALGLPVDASEEDVKEALGLPADATPEQVREALIQKGIIPERRQ